MWGKTAGNKILLKDGWVHNLLALVYSSLVFVCRLNQPHNFTIVNLLAGFPSLHVVMLWGCETRWGHEGTNKKYIKQSFYAVRKFAFKGHQQ